VRALRARNDDQAAEIARLKAAIAVFEREAEGDGKGAIRESRIALKARAQSLEAQATQQAETVLKLRGELALANERLARQAAHFTSELKRLGAGSGGGQGRRSGTAARTTLADRVAQARAAIAGPSGERPSAEASGPPPDDIAVAAGSEANRVEAAASHGSTPAADIGETPAPLVDEAVLAASDDAAKTIDPKREVAVASAGARPRLLDRIAGLSRTS
jgi:hypothetical protein